MLPKNLIARVLCRTFSEQRLRRPALARAVRAALAMGTAESSRGRRETSPKQEYRDQVLKYVDERRKGWFIYASRSIKFNEPGRRKEL